MHALHERNLYAIYLPICRYNLDREPDTLAPLRFRSVESFEKYYAKKMNNNYDFSESNIFRLQVYRKQADFWGGFFNVEKTFQVDVEKQKEAAEMFSTDPWGLCQELLLLDPHGFHSDLYEYAVGTKISSVPKDFLFLLINENGVSYHWTDQSQNFFLSHIE